MSEENVEIVRQAIDVFNAFMRGELSRETVTKFTDPQFEFHWHEGRELPDSPQEFRGVPAMIELWEQWRRVLALTWEPLEFIEASDDRVLTVTRQSGRGRESGVPTEIELNQLWTIRDGVLHRLELFRHRADALEAAGLRE
jgi:ketosteroid isomerase-like protein